MYAPAERADTLILFLLYPFLLCGQELETYPVKTLLLVNTEHLL
jgi:hypothetical protein